MKIVKGAAAGATGATACITLPSSGRCGS